MELADDLGLVDDLGLEELLQPAAARPMQVIVASAATCAPRRRVSVAIPLTIVNNSCAQQERLTFRDLVVSGPS